MAGITFTDTESGKSRGSSQEGPGNKLSNGDTYVRMTRAAISADGAPDGKTIFQVTTLVPDGASIGTLSISGAPGKDNTLILPGKASDYKVDVAQSPQGLGGKQKMGDITFTDKEGRKINTHNIKSVGYADDSATPVSVVNDLASGKLQTTPTQQLHDKAYKALPIMEQCKHQALTSDEAGKAFPTQQQIRNSEQLQQAQGAAVAKASKSCPAR